MTEGLLWALAHLALGFLAGWLLAIAHDQITFHYQRLQTLRRLRAGYNQKKKKKR